MDSTSHQMRLTSRNRSEITGGVIVLIGLLWLFGWGESNPFAFDGSDFSRVNPRSLQITLGSSILGFMTLVMLTSYFRSHALLLKQAEERRNEEHEWLELTLRSIGDAVIATDARGLVSFMNRVAETLTGWTQVEALGKPIVEVFRVVHETTRQPVENPSLRAIRERSIVALASHSVLIAKDRTERFVEDSAAPIQRQGKPIAGSVLVFRDVTERRLQEENHREVLSRLESTLKAGDVGTWEYDLVRLSLRADRNFSRMVGISEQDSLGNTRNSFLNAIHPDDRERVVELFDHAVNANEVFQSEHRLIGTDGIVRWVVSRGRVEGSAANGTLRMSGMVVDITERKLADERARLHAAEAHEAHAKFRAFFDQGLSFSMIIDLGGQIIETNRLAWEGCGYTKDEIKGKLFWEGPWWSPSAELVETIKVAATEAESGRIFRSELPYYVADGTERIVDFLLVPIKNDAGRVLFLASTGTDITDRKRAEADRQKFVALAETSLDFIAIYDLSGTPIYINHAGLELIGLDTFETALRTPVRDFFFEEDQALMIEQFIPKVLRQGHGEIEVRFRNFKTGVPHWMACKILTLPDRNGAPGLLASVSQDITSRKNLEDSLRQSADDLARADRRKDEFLATLAHELRNPLAPVRNALQLMRLDPENLQVAEESRILMERQVAHMVHLIDDLMDVSRINRAKLELRKVQVPLADVIQTAVETSLPLIDASAHELTVKLPSSPVFVEADVTRLAQVVSNLLNNAAKYTEFGGKILLHVDCQETDVRISVRDNGVGIPASMLPKIFDLFTQVDESLERAQGGLGIGLALVKNLVEMHGGTISVRSEGTNRGTEFVVRLPILVADGTSLNQPKTPIPFRNQKPESIRTAQRILVVDDNQDSARTLARLLKFLGYETQVAHDGEDAVRKASDWRPEILILDIGLPLMNGYDVATTIRGMDWGQELAIIALTGWGQESDRKRSKEAGINNHLVKPVDPETLERILAEVRVGQFSANI